MRKLFLFALLNFCQLINAAENDPPVQDSDLQGAVQVESDSSIETQEEVNDLVVTENLDTNEDRKETAARFIPTEQISQDFGVSFPVDI